MSDYYILSLKWSKPGGTAFWWGPNNCGYVTDLAKAGVYSQTEIEGDRGYYDNGMTTKALPVEAVNALAWRAVQFNDTLTIPQSL